MMLTETRPAPVEEVTTIKPSEALRLGRLERPVHTPGELTNYADGACALGAMHFGWGTYPQSTLAVSREFVQAFNRFIGDDWGEIAELFDETEARGEDGDAAVLAYLEERGL